MPQVQPWSVDPKVHVDRVHVIESLPPDQQSWYYRTGARLFGELQDVCAGMPVQPHLHVVSTRDDLCALLRGVIGEAESGHFPLLHFETHGVERVPGRTTTSIGISGEVMPWRDLAPFLVAINEATRLNLIVFVSACYGLDIATLFQPLEPAPARLVIGPMRPIDVPEIDRTTRAFYHSLLRDRNGEAAAMAMNAAIGPGKDVSIFLLSHRRVDVHADLVGATSMMRRTKRKSQSVRIAWWLIWSFAVCRPLLRNCIANRCEHFFEIGNSCSIRRIDVISLSRDIRRSRTDSE